MGHIDFDDVLSGVDDEFEKAYFSDSDYDVDEEDESIECIECDELGDVIDVFDIPYSDISGTQDAAVGAGFHVKVNKPSAASFGIKVPVKSKVKSPVKKKKATPVKAGGAGIFGIAASAALKTPVSIASVIKASAKLQTPKIKPGSKTDKVLKKFQSHPKISGKVDVNTLKKVAMAVTSPHVQTSSGTKISTPFGSITVPNIKIPVVSPVIQAALPSIAPIVQPPAPIPLPIPATSPAVSKVEVQVTSPAKKHKIKKIRAAKKMPEKRPKHSLTFIPPKRHEMVCLGQMVPRRLYDLVIEAEKHKRQKRKERACKCAEAIKGTPVMPTDKAHIRTKVRGAGGKKSSRKSSGEKVIQIPRDSHVRIACGLPA